MLYLNGFEFWRHFNWNTVYMTFSIKHRNPVT